MGKISVCDKIIMENRKKRENIEMKEIIHKSLCEKIFYKWNSQLAKAS